VGLVMNARFIGGPIDGERRAIPPTEHYFVAVMEPFRPLFRASPEPDAEPVFKKHEYKLRRIFHLLDGDVAYFDYKGITC